MLYCLRYYVLRFFQQQFNEEVHVAQYETPVIYGSFIY